MSLSPAILDALLAAGATADMIVAAVKADMAGTEEAKAAKRAKDAERQRLHRQSHDVSRDVTVTACDITDIAPPPLDGPPEKKSNTPPLIPHNTNIQSANRWHRMPDDWQPNALPRTLESRRTGWPPGWEANELERFRSWAANAANTNGKGRKLDWDQAWHNWLRGNENEQRPNTPARLQPRVGSGEVSDRLAAGLRLRAQFGTAA